jgi:hypothetical protein
MAISAEIPPLNAFNFVLRYQGDVGAHNAITASSYDEVVESRAIYCKFDDRTSHTMFVIGEVSKSYMLSGLPGWADVTLQFMEELKNVAVVEALVEDVAELSKDETNLLAIISQSNGIGKRDAIAQSGVSEDDWLPTVRILLDRGAIKKSGIGKYTTYKAA